MAHMLVAGLNSRSLGFRSLHCASLKVGCKQKLLLVGHIVPQPRPAIVASPLSRECPPRQRFTLNCTLFDPSSTPSSSSSQSEADILSTKGCAAFQVQTKDACARTHAETTESHESIIKNQGVLRLRSGGAIRPHPSKVKSGGEDAYVIEGTSWAGVADGVGGWALSGVDSGLYSRELMTNCGLLAKSEKGVPNPKAVIIEGVKKTNAVGTCTAVLAALHKQILHVANVGDSGFLIVRNGEVLAKSTPMQHGFNCPYQIGTEGDDPATAETFEVPVASGDVLVLATDGVYDNLYEGEIVHVVDLGLKKGVEPETVAAWLVNVAHQAGLNTEVRSPFSDAAQAAGYNHAGGKLDDATAVVSYVE